MKEVQEDNTEQKEGDKLEAPADGGAGAQTADEKSRPIDRRQYA